MKDSKEYSPKLMKLAKSLKRGGEKPSMPTFEDPIEAVIYGLLSETITEAAAAKIYKRLKSHFIDLNDLRVSRVEEIQDVMRDVSEPSEKSARAVTQVLNTIFDKTDRISLNLLGQEGKRQAHKDLTEIPGITRFAADYAFVTALGGHAIPMTDRMLEYVKQNGLVHPEATPEEISGFLERQIPAGEAYEFYVLLRNEVEQGASTAGSDASPKKKKAAAKSTKTAKNATKKTK